MMGRAFLSLAVPAVALSGCLSETTTTRLEVVDPSLVAIAGHASRLDVRQHGDIVLEDGAFETEPGASSHYRLRAVREETGEIALEWDAHVPLLNGEHQTLVDRSGVVDLGATSLSSYGKLGEGPGLAFSSCASLARRKVKGRLVGYDAIEWSNCSALANVPYTLETPWSNVKRLREHVEPDRGVAFVAMFLGTLMFGGLGTVLLALPSCRDGTNRCDATVQRTLGFTFVGIAGAIDLAWIPTLVAPSRDVVSYP
jgi:hypothetical protein